MSKKCSSCLGCTNCKCKGGDVRNQKILKFGEETLSGWIVASMPMSRADAEREFERGNYPDDLYRVERFGNKWYIVTSPIMA